MKDKNKLSEFVNNFEELLDIDSTKYEIKSLSLSIDNIKKEADKIISTAKELEEECKLLKIGIVGQMKAGKSSFLNSLIFNGENVLPRASTPMTAGLTIMEYSEEQCFEIEYYSKEDWKVFKMYDNNYSIKKAEVLKQYPGDSFMQESELKNVLTEEEESAHLLLSNCKLDANKKIGKEKEIISINGVPDLQYRLNDYVGANGRFTSITKSLTVKLKDDRLKGLRIVDTPGVNDPVVSRDNRTKEFLRSCHGVFLLSYAGRFCDSTDMAFLKDRISGEGIGAIILLASKFDSVLIDEAKRYNDDFDSAEENCKERLKDQALRTLKEIEFNGKIGRDSIDINSGICYSLLQKPESEWDEMEQMVSKNLKRWYPTLFRDNDENEIYEYLANIEPISEKYLKGVFLDKKTDIINEKTDLYKSKSIEKLQKIINDEIKINTINRKNLEKGEVDVLKKQVQEINNVLKKNKNKIDELFSKLYQSLQKHIKNIRIELEERYELNLPFSIEPTTVKRKRFFSEKKIEVHVRKFDSYDVRRYLEGFIEEKIEKFGNLWRDQFGCEGLIFSQLNNGIRKSIIDQAKEDCLFMSFDADTLLHLVNKSLDSLVEIADIPLGDLLFDYNQKVLDLCTSSMFSYVIPTSEKDNDEDVYKEAQLIYNNILANIDINIKTDIVKAIIGEMIERMESAAELLRKEIGLSQKDFFNVFESNLSDYTKELVSQIKDKEDSLNQYKVFENEMKQLQEELLN